MKNILFVLCFFALATITSCRHRNNNDIKISVSDSEEEYKFSASFDKYKTGKVHHYIENSLDKNGLFGTENDSEDYTTTLDDKMTFHIQASPGEIKLILNKVKNSPEAYAKMKQVGQGISELLKRK